MRRRCGIRSLRERAPRLRAAENDITNAAAGRGEKIMSTFPIMDADAHMCEPPNLWTERIDQQFRDRAPRIVKDLNGRKGAFFVCKGLPPFPCLWSLCRRSSRS